MEDYLNVVWIFLVPFALLFLLGAAWIILKSQRDPIVDYPMFFILIGRLVFCGCVVIILCVVDFCDIDWTESLCFFYYWTYATTTLFDSITIFTTLATLLILVSYRRNIIKCAPSILMVTFGILLLASISTVGAIFVYRQKIHPYPFEWESQHMQLCPTTTTSRTCIHWHPVFSASLDISRFSDVRLPHHFNQFTLFEVHKLTEKNGRLFMCQQHERHTPHKRWRHFN